MGALGLGLGQRLRLGLGPRGTGPAWWAGRGLAGSLPHSNEKKIEQRKERKEREVSGKICAWG